MKRSACIATLALLAACSSSDRPTPIEAGGEHATPQVVKGSHNGRLLTDGSFAIELAIFETGVPPEFHAWPTMDGKPLPLDQVGLTVDLTRLNKSEQFTFAPQGDFLRAAHVVHEPHSFVVKVARDARRQIARVDLR